MTDSQTSRTSLLSCVPEVIDPVGILLPAARRASHPDRVRQAVDDVATEATAQFDTVEQLVGTALARQKLQSDKGSNLDIQSQIT